MASQWYVMRNKQQHGPFSAEQLKQMAMAGRLQRQDLLLQEGTPNWVVANSMAGLFPTVRTAPPQAIAQIPVPGGQTFSPAAWSPPQTYGPTTKIARSRFWVISTHVLTAGFAIPLVANFLAFAAVTGLHLQGTQAVGASLVILFVAYLTGTGYSLFYLRRKATLDGWNSCTTPSIVAFIPLAIAGCLFNINQLPMKDPMMVGAIVMFYAVIAFAFATFTRASFSANDRTIATASPSPGTSAVAAAMANSAIAIGGSPPSASSYRLHSLGNMGLATFFGGLIAGGHLMATNYKRLGNPKLARRTWFFCIALFIAEIALIAVLMHIFPKIDLRACAAAATGANIAAILALAARSQANAIKLHQAAGGALASGLAAFGIGVLWCLILVAASIGLESAVSDLRGSAVPTQSEVVSQAGSTLDVRFEGDISRDQAHNLAKMLLDIPNFIPPGGHATVLASRSSAGATISFVLQEGAWNRPGVSDEFREIARHVADSIGGLPLQVRLINEQVVEKASFSVD